MAFSNWLPQAPRNETIDDPFLTPTFNIAGDEGFIAIRVTPQAVLGVAGQRIVIWIEARKVGTTEFQHVLDLNIDCVDDPEVVTRQGWFSGDTSLLGGEYDQLKAGYYVINGPVTFGVQGEIRKAQQRRK